MPYKMIMSLMILLGWTISAMASDRDIKIPVKLWEKIEQANGEIKDGTLNFFPVIVTLQEKSDGVLNENSEKIVLPRGGGDVDLSKYVKGDKGTFTVQFDLEDYKPEDLQVYYISQARKRKIDGDIWGAGCRKFLNITSYFLSTAAKDGLVVNTTRNRHLTVLGGNFVFVRKSGKQILLSQVTFTDSSQPQLFCDGISAEKE